MTPPVAMLYHAVAPAPREADRIERRTLMDPAAFARQMEALARNGYRTLTLREYVAALESRSHLPRRVLLTFDDAYAHVDEAVTPILVEHGFTAVMFAPWAHLGSRNTWDIEHPHLARLEIMTTDQLRALERGPWEVASHAGRHVDLRRLEPGARLRELREAREGLSEVLGREVVELAYPYGDHDASVRQDARRAGFRIAFTASGGGSTDLLQLPRRPIDAQDSTIAVRFKAIPSAVWLYRARARLRHLPWGAASPGDQAA